MAIDLRSAVLTALDRLNLSLERMESRDGAIVTHWRISGRNTRGVPDLGIPPNGRLLDVEAVTVDRIVDGRPDHRMLIDLSKVIDQLAPERRSREPSLSAV